MAQVLIVAFRDPVIPLDARSSTSLLDEGCVPTNSGTSAQFSDRLRRTLVAPPICATITCGRV